MKSFDAQMSARMIEINERCRRAHERLLLSEQLAEEARNRMSMVANRINALLDKQIPQTQVQVTKKQRAFAIYDDIMHSMPYATRLEVIKAFMEELDMTYAGAASYFQQARDRLVMVTE